MRRSVWAALLAMLLSLLLTQLVRAATITQTWSVGVEPFGVTVDPRDGTVFVAVSNHFNYQNNPEYMWAIDPTVPLPYDPYALPRFQLPAPQVMSVLDVGLSRLFVSLTNGLAMVDLPSRSVTTVPGAASAGLALDPVTHRVYIAQISGVIAVDGATGNLVASRRAPGGSDAYWHVAHDPTRHLLFVTNGNYGGAPSLVVLNDGDLSLVGEMPLPAIPRLALSVDPARGLVYVGGWAMNRTTPGDPVGRLYAIDETSLQIVKTLDLGGGVASVFSSTLVAETNTLYASMITNGYPQANAIAVVDTSTFTVSNRVALAFQPGQSALHPDGHLYVSDFSSGRLVALDLANHAPIIQSLSFSPASPTTNDRLSANVDATDPDLGPGGYPTYPRSVTYEWSRNGTVLSDVTGSTIDLAQPGHGDRGDTISVVVTASDGDLTATRSASVVIGNAAPTVSLSLDSSAPRTNDVLHALAIANDADGDPFTVTYAWSRNGTTIPGANGPTLDLASYGDRGDVIVATVTAVDDHGGTRTASASATVADSAPVASLALNTTAPRTLDSIVATVSASDADGDAITYLWYLRRNGNVVYSTSGSATASFDLSQPGWGDRWDTVTVQAVVGDRTLTTLVERSVTVVNTPPSVMPVLSSTTPRRGDVLVATAVVDDPDGETALTYTFTWTIGQKVRQTTTTGSSSDSFSLAGYNVGDVVKVTVVARDPFDASAPATATATISPR